MYKVAVLLSAYNGEKYLREQIDSILAQKDVCLDLYIRDDGSNDNTISIIEEYAHAYENIIGYRGSNIGVGNSFMGLLYKVSDQYDYYAFSDQDDIWLDNKIKKAIELIHDSEEPVLYTSNQTLTNQDLDRMGPRYSVLPCVDYKQIVFSNQLAGCTMVWNSKLNNYLSDEARRPSKELLECRIHDVWVALTAAVVGKIIYDPNSYILYRQHKDNVVGAKGISVISGWWNKIKHASNRNGRSRICNEIIGCFGDVIIRPEIHDTLIRFGDYSNNIRSKIELIKDKSIYSYTKETKAGLTMKILLGLF